MKDDSENNSHFCGFRMCEALLQSETEQKKLIRCQLNLQENIDIKANSLYIDEVICAQLREPIAIHSL